MITRKTFVPLLEAMEFTQISNDIYSKVYKKYNNFTISVDFHNKAIIYPEPIQKGSDGTSNFNQDENAVVLECVNRLLVKGYRPEHLFLEKTWTLGHTGKGGRADIAVIDKNGKDVLIIIECKTAGKKYRDARKDLFENPEGKQLFSYAKQAGSTKWLDLYASELNNETGEIVYKDETIKCHDDKNVITLSKRDSSIRLYRDASEASDLFIVWDETYNKRVYPGVIFGADSVAYNIGIKPLKKKDLKPFDKEEKIADSFKEILRHNSISDKENAFNKLLSLFICKMVDEKETSEDSEVEFQYKDGTDDYYTLYERLLRLYQKGMDDYLKEDVFYLPQSYISEVLNQYTGKQRKELEKVLSHSFQQTKLLSCQVFAFREVYNETLFLQNGKILVEMVELFQRYRMSYSSRQQFLGEMFEDLLNQGFKQDEGQYFTPTPITRFVWNSIPYERFVNLEKRTFPKVIDYACGAGHFLTEGISAIADFYKDSGVPVDKPLSDEEISTTFYGIEKDNRLARVCKTALLLNGANKANIKADDGLAKNEEFFHGKEQSFDVLVANPPYAVDGFKAHLTREILNKYQVLPLMSLACDDIENVFVERIEQLLKPKGIAAVVLPMSILTGTDSSTILTREILLCNFFIRAIASFSGKTFGETSQRTVILFLEKFNEPPKRSIVVKDSVTAIYNDEDLSGWEDNEILASYLNEISLSITEYQKFVTKSEDIEYWKESRYFETYVEKFLGLTDTTNFVESEKFKNLSEQQQQDALKQRFYNFAFDVEKEKIYYFSLTYKQTTLLINAPDDTEKQKEFLGYNIVKRGGKEGLKERKGLLTNIDDRLDPTKIAWFVKQAYNGVFSTDDSVAEYVSFAPLTDLLDFSRAYFDKNLKTVSKKDLILKSVFPQKSLGDKKKFYLTLGKRIVLSDIKEDYNIPAYSANVITPFGNWKEKFFDDYSLPSVLWGIDGNWMVNFIEKDIPFYPTDHCGVLRCKTNEYNPFYIYVVLKKVGALNRFSRFYRASVERMEGVYIPDAPLETQNEIAKRCINLEKKYVKGLNRIASLKGKIKQLLSELGGDKVTLKKVAPFTTNRISYNTIDPKTFITTDNLLQDCEGYEIYRGTPSVDSIIEYKQGDILLSNIRSYLRKMIYAQHSGGCSPDVLVMRVSDTNKYRPEFVYYMLWSGDFFDYISIDTKGNKMPRGKKEHIEEYEFQIPNTELQDAILSKISPLEKSIATLKKELESINEEEDEILSELLTHE